MKKILLSQLVAAFLFIIPINLYSQQKLKEFSLKIQRPTEAYIASDSIGNLVAVFQSNKQYELDFMDPEFNIVQSSISEKLSADKNQKIIGGVLKGDQSFTYFYHKKLKAFSLLSANKSTGAANYTKLLVLNPTDQFLSAFELKGKFYLLTIPKSGTSLKVLAFTGKEMEEMSYNMEMAGFYVALTKGNDMLNSEVQSEVGIEDIKYDFENNIKSSYPAKKLYHFEDKIVFTFDEPNLTHMITIDLTNKKADYKKLNFTLEKGNYSNDKQGNSFLYQNRFFRSTVSPEQLNISILDLDSMKLINTYNFYPGADINILNGPIIQEGGTGTYTTDEKIIRRSDQYFRRVLEGNLAIAANKIDSNKYEVQVGSYELYNSAPYRTGYSTPGLSLGMGMGMGVGMGNGFGYPYGGFGYPGSYYGGYPGYYPSQSSMRQRITYFKSILGNEAFDHQDGNVPANMKDKINDYEYRTFRNNMPDVLKMSSYKNALLLGYYLRSTRKFNIVEFRNN